MGALTEFLWNCMEALAAFLAEENTFFEMEKAKKSVKKGP